MNKYLTFYKLYASLMVLNLTRFAFSQRVTTIVAPGFAMKNHFLFRADTNSGVWGSGGLLILRKMFLFFSMKLQPRFIKAQNCFKLWHKMQKFSMRWKWCDEEKIVLLNFPLVKPAQKMLQFLMHSDRPNCCVPFLTFKK